MAHVKLQFAWSRGNRFQDQCRMHQHSHQYGSRWPNASVRTGVDALTNVPGPFVTSSKTSGCSRGRTLEPPGPGSALNASNVSRCYPRQREYPHPPPPSKNKTRRIINMVVISHLSSLQCRAGWGPKLNLRRTAPGRLSRCGEIRSHDLIGSWQEPHRRASTRKPVVAAASHCHCVSQKSLCTGADRLDGCSFQSCG